MTNRREFIAGSVAAGLAVAGASTLGADTVVETDVNIKTDDGMCDACFMHPSSGSHPAVLIWPDALGLRPVMRAMARRLAAEGYSVLVPNPFYRVSRAPQFETAATLAFTKGGVPNEIEVYPARHGWCVADMPIEKGAPVYDATQAERAWGKLLALYKSALA